MSGRSLLASGAGPARRSGRKRRRQPSGSEASASPQNVREIHDPPPPQPVLSQAHVGELPLPAELPLFPQAEPATVAFVPQDVDVTAAADEEEDEGFSFNNQQVEERGKMPPVAKYGRSYPARCGKKEAWFTPSRLPPLPTHHKGKPILFRKMWVAANFFAVQAGMPRHHRNPMMLIDVEVEGGYKSMKDVIDTHYSQH